MYYLSEIPLLILPLLDNRSYSYQTWSKKKRWATLAHLAGLASSSPPTNSNLPYSLTIASCILKPRAIYLRSC